MELIQRIWQENKKFLLKAGGGFILFLILQSCVIQGIHNSAQGQRARNQKLEQSISKLKPLVFNRHGEEKKNVEELAVIEEDLRARFTTPPPRDVPDPRRDGTQLHFSNKIENLWNELLRKSNQKNIKIPEKVSPHDLGVRPEDDAIQLAVHASALEILGRALRACIENGVAEIQKPIINQEEESFIRLHDDDVLAIGQRIGLSVRGTYESIQGVFRQFQQPGEFVQVRLVGLDARSAGSSGALRGQLEFSSFRIWSLEEEEKSLAREEAEEKSRRGSKGRRRP